VTAPQTNRATITLTDGRKIYLDSAANLFIADRLNLRIREVNATIAGIQYPIMKEGKISLPIAQRLESEQHPEQPALLGGRRVSLRLEASL